MVCSLSVPSPQFSSDNDLNDLTTRVDFESHPASVYNHPDRQKSLWYDGNELTTQFSIIASIQPLAAIELNSAIQRCLAVDTAAAPQSRTPKDGRPSSLRQVITLSGQPRQSSSRAFTQTPSFTSCGYGRSSRRNSDRGSSYRVGHSAGHC